jgi:predicted permease
MASIFLDILAPVFLVVAIGAMAGRRLALEPTSLSRLAYWILGPFFVFDVLSRAETAPDVVVKMVAAGLGSMVVAGVVAWTLGSAARHPYGARAAAVMTSVYGNVGNFGLAVVVFTFGPDALPLAGIMLIVINIAGLIVGVTAASRQRTSLLAAIRTALFAPMTLSVPPAIVVNVGNIDLPLWVDRPVSLIAGAMIPVMLLTLGVQLAGMSAPKLGLDLAVPIGAKLVVAPLVAAVAASLLGLGGTEAGVVVLQSAMPAAVFTALIAMEHDLEPELVTTTVLVGTLASVFTLPIVIALLT